jgi:hypothetical protein
VFPVNIIHTKAEQLGLDYLVIGGQAFNTFGAPRTTLDVDFLVRKESRDAWARMLHGEGFRLAHDGGNFLQFSPPYGVEWNLDLMLVNDSTFEKLHATARHVILLGVATKTPSAENLIRLKLHALRHGPEHRRSQDLADVISLVRLAQLDVRSEAFRKLIEEHGTAEIYNRILEETPR